MAEAISLTPSAPEPARHDLLPTNDDDWENGKVGPSESLYTRSFSSVTEIGPFAKTCQAAHMLSKVTSHRQAKRASRDVTELLPEALNLFRALQSLGQSLEDEQTLSPNVLPAVALCACSRLLLANEYSCNEETTVGPDGQPIALGTELQQLCMDSIKALSSITPRLMTNDVTGCPFISRFLYYAATECVWFIKEDHEQVMYESLKETISALRRLESRSAVAGK